jgi:hypothetical protein
VQLIAGADNSGRLTDESFECTPLAQCSDENIARVYLG